MKGYAFILTNITLLILLFGCSTTTTTLRMMVTREPIGKISYKRVNDKNIEKGQAGVLIQLFDFETKTKISIADVKELPGIVKDSTMNSKLLIFNRDSIPQRIIIKKAKKGGVIISPEVGKKNLVIYKLYLYKAEAGIF